MTQDHLGSPRVITNEIGAVVGRRDFTAFGEEAVTAQRSAGLGYAEPEIRKNYTGYEKDTESGLEFAQARYYNPTHGRFTSVDPLTASASIRDPQTFNRYSYVLNSPYKFTDPLGLLPVSWSSGGCSAEYSSCDENGRGKEFDEHANRIYQTEIARLQAQQAFARGDTERGSRIIRESEGMLQAQDQNRNAVQDPNEPTITGPDSTGANPQQQDGTVTVSVQIDSPIATDSAGYNYIIGTETGTYNCMSFGFGITSSWEQPDSGETLEQFAIRKGAIRWHLGERIPNGYTLMKIYEDSADSSNWHVMRRMSKGDWWSKNGGTPL